MATINTITDKIDTLEDCQYIFNEMQITNDPILKVIIKESQYDISNNKLKYIDKVIYLNKRNIIGFYE